MASGVLTVNQGTNQGILVDQAGTVDIGVVKLDTSAAGTYGSLWTGNVGVSTGTITQIPNIPGGTVNSVGSVVGLGGTTSVSVIGGTVSVNELSGTLNLGTITGNVGVSSGTITTGTILSSGTITGVGTVTNLGSITNVGQVYNAGTLQAGTINAATITAGSIVVTTGTFVANGGSHISYGPAAAAAAAAGNPLNMGGTDSGGTIRTIKVDSGGLQRIGVDSGTITVLPNLPQGSINVTAGTVNTGTINTGTVNAGTINVATVSAGSIVVTAGTLAAGTVNLGTVVGKDANAAAQTGNPIGFGGTDSGGTIRTVLVNSSGALSVTGASAGTFVNLTTGTLNAGTINTGTINTGTINLGSFVGKDANAAAQTGNPVAFGGTDSGGTIRTASVDSTGAVKVVGASAGTFVNLTTGTLNLGTFVGKDANAAAQTGNPVSVGGTDSGGTVRTVLVDSAGAMKTTASVTASFGTIQTGTINAGTFTVTAGTINTGTVNAGTINVATISAGSIIVTAGTLATGTINTGTINLGTFVGNVASGVTDSGNPVKMGGIYNSALPTFSNGQRGDLQLDTNGLLRVNPGALSSTNDSVTAVGKDANGSAQTGNAIAIGGTDSGGTVRTVLVNSSGALSVTGASAGTFVNLTTGTLNAGTINAATITAGSIVVTTGTFVGNGGSVISYGPTAAAAAAAGNPLNMGGTDSGGTIRTIKVDSGGLQRVGIDSGTISVLPNLPQGSINVTAGTVNAGTINTGTINIGTFVGKDANAAAQTGNPVGIGGTDSGGTIRTILVSSTGAMNIGTVSVLPNLPQGSITVTAGTIGTVVGAGTVTNLGSVTNVGQVYNAGTLQAGGNTIGNIGTLITGTILSSGTSTGVGTLTNVGSVTNIGQIYNAGTIQAGTIRNNPSPTIVSVTYGTTTSGTIGTLVAAPSAGSAIIITSLVVNVQNGTAEPCVSWGLQQNGNQVLNRGNYSAGGGVALPMTNAVSGSATGTALTFNVLSGAGTVSYNVAYFVAVP